MQLGSVDLGEPSLLWLIVVVLGLAALAVVLRLRKRRTASRDWLVIDGSNVMHWRDGVPMLATLREVVGVLQRRGFALGVVFDANAGYKLMGRYLDDRALAKALGLPEAQVFVVPKGTQADLYVLQAAQKIGARVVTNDRFRDWAEAHPEVMVAGHLIRGGYQAKGLWFEGLE